jgi:hypothetical protein
MGDRTAGTDRGLTRHVPRPVPIGGLEDLADLLGGDSDRSRRFLGGLIAGALVGAAVAGSALVRNRGVRVRRLGRPRRPR